MFAVIIHLTCRSRAYCPGPTLAGQDDLEQSKSSFAETHLDHINMSKLEI